jgi:carotenoid 1,2-hydratase
VAPGGYHWWYLDALDATGREGLVIIAFIGSVFSPYYHRARARGKASAEHFSALNVGIYTRGRKRWCMTERREQSVSRSPDQLVIGSSQLNWRNGMLDFDIRERSAPLGQAIHGRVRVKPLIVSSRSHDLDKFGDECGDRRGRHHWMPWSPLARVDVEFDAPQVSWSGEGYLDSNYGEEPLEAGFSRWDWSRTRAGSGVQVQYDVTRIDGRQSEVSLAFGQDGQCVNGEIQPCRPLRRTGWGINREPRSGQPLSLLRTLEDTPFYSRSLLQSAGPEGPVFTVHESLSLDRFRRPWVRALLPFRMPRELSGLA